MSNWHRPAGSAARGTGSTWRSAPREAGWEHAGLNVLTLAPGERRLIMTSGLRVARAAPGRPVPGRVRHAGDKVLFLEGRRRPVRRPDRLRVRPAHVPLRRHQHARCPAGAAPRDGREPAAVPSDPRRGVRHRARGAPATPPARSATSAPPDVLDATRSSPSRCSPRRELVLLPAAQARRGRARTSRRELEEIYYFEMRGADARCARNARPFGYQRVYGTPPGRSTCWPRCAPVTWSCAARLARPVDGRARLRPVLPERHGRPGEPAGLADLRRPRARLGPRRRGSRTRSTPGCPFEGRR